MSETVLVRRDYLEKLFLGYCNDLREWMEEHYGNTEDLSEWLDNPPLNHIKEVLGL
jgi:hypothetical protein